MPVTFERECGPKCRSKYHNQEVNAVITRGALKDFQAYSQLCHTWAQHTDTAGRSALHVAASCGKQEIAEWLVVEKKLDVSLKDKESGWTALHRALFYGQLSVARLLIQCNSELYVRDHEGLGPLDLVVKDHPQNLSFNHKDRNEVYTWGDNTNFTLGHASEQRRSFPEAVDTFRRGSITVKEIVMSKYHSVFLTQGGQIYTCGHGPGGRLGHGDERTCVTPRLMESLQNDVCTAIAAGRDHTVFLTDKNMMYSCGLNDCQQLGVAGSGDRGATDKSLVPVKMNVKMLKGKTVLGIGAGRFHTTAFTADGIYTCGLNAGHIGHQKGERYQPHLRQVLQLFHKDASVGMVSCSDAAIACLTSRGDLFLLHEYTCRKIAARWQDIKKLFVIGGNLDHNTDMDVLREKGGSEIKVVLLNTFGKVFQWRGGSPSMKRCRWVLRRQINVSDVALNASGMVIATDQGEAFAAYPTSRKTGNQQKDSSKDGIKETEEDFGKMSLLDLLLKDEVEEMGVRRLPGVHRASYVTCDRKGLNCAALQALPKSCLTDVPSVSKSTMNADLLQMMKEADLCDAIHDGVLRVGERSWPVHLYILASRADFFRRQTVSSGSTPKEITVHDIQPDVMEQLLKYIYTDTCDVLNVGSHYKFSCTEKRSEQLTLDERDAEVIADNPKVVSSVEVGAHSKKGKVGKEEGTEKSYKARDPIKILQEAARKLGVKGLAKRLETMRYVNGVIQSTGKKMAPLQLKFDRTKLPELHDVCIRAEDDTAVQCHKCMLAARLEYFHSMLGSGWIESSDTTSVKLPIPGEVLEILLAYVYTDELSVLGERQDIELLCNVLVVADQLLVTRLKEMCEETLTGLLTLRNAGDLLEFATTYNAKQLELACQQFIRLNLPALLETRNLDMVGDDTMQELTSYYRSVIPAMSRRLITPWSEGPDTDYLSSLAAELCPERERALTSRDTASRKSKHRRRQNRTKSVSEDGQTSPGGLGKVSAPVDRQVSVSSDVSVQSEEDVNVKEGEVECKPASITLLADSFDVDWKKVYQTFLKNVEHVKAREAIPLKEYSQQASSAIPIEHPSKTRQDSGGISSLSPGCEAQCASMEQAGSTGLPAALAASWVPGLREIMKLEEQDLRDKQVTKAAGSARFSWKDVKKQQNKGAQAQKSPGTTIAPLSPTIGEGVGQLSAVQSLSAVSGATCPWGSVNKVVQSFRDLMLQDKGEQSNISGVTLAKSPPSSSTQRSVVATVFNKSVASRSQPAQSLNVSWGLPLRAAPPPSSTPIPSPNCPSPIAQPANPWHRGVCASPPDSSGASLRFSDIMQDEMQQKNTLDRVAQKPLHLIQMEEKAMDDLLQFYHTSKHHDEHVTIERASSTMAAPLWRCQRSSASGHT